MELKELITKIEQWAIDRELDKKATVEAQSIKTAEEMAELIIGISKDNIEVIKDSIGDVFVTLVIGNMICKEIEIREVLRKIEHKDVKTLSSCGKIYLIHELGISIAMITIYGYLHNMTFDLLKNLMAIADIYNLDFTDCVQYAYNEIKDRKGKTINGQFVKEADL